MTGEKRKPTVPSSARNSVETAPRRDEQISLHGIEDHIQNAERPVETDDRFLIIAETANVALFVVRDARLIYSNIAMDRLLDFEHGEVVNADMLDFIHPDERQQVEAMFQTQEQGTSAMSHRETRVLCNNGEERWIDLASSPILFENRPAVVGTAFDITDRKNTEIERKNYIQRLEIIQQVDGELTKLLKFEYVLKIALEAAVDITHADAGAIHLVEGDAMKVAQVIGNFPSSMIGSHIAIDRGIVGRVFRNQRAELVHDVQNDPDYIRNIIETRAQMTIPLIVQDRVIGVLNVQTVEPGIFTSDQFDFLKMLASRIASALENARLYDTSQNHLSELQSLYEQVSALEQMKTQMIRVAAHDLRNPLEIISGYLQMLGWNLESALTENSRGYLHIIEQGVERIDKITRDILTLERVNTKQELSREQVDMRELVIASGEEFRFQAVDKSLDYQVEITETPASVQGDRVLLQETIRNLISNAIKYTPEQGRIWVRLRTDMDSLVFEVHDTGYGIPQEQQEHLFEAFYRVSLKETRAIKGTGLGLHLVKNIIEQHKGHMYFTSAYEKGSIFGFELPLVGKPKRNTRKNSSSLNAQ